VECGAGRESCRGRINIIITTLQRDTTGYVRYVIIQGRARACTLNFWTHLAVGVDVEARREDDRGIGGGLQGDLARRAK